MTPSILCLKAGLVSYEKGLSLQKQARAMVESGQFAGILLLLEHRPVITAGRSGGRENLIASLSELQAAGVEFIESDRGGNVTCHNPGQLIGYPVLDLSHWRQDVHWYVNRLEEVLIQTLATYGIIAGRKSKYTGVWVENRKIAAIGVIVRRWITGHGFALNVQNNLALFNAIVPCGIEEFGVTSMQRQGLSVEMQDVENVLSNKFREVFAAVLTVETGGDLYGEK
jgi:lipoyl(octanoyl) transferase